MSDKHLYNLLFRLYGHSDLITKLKYNIKDEKIFFLDLIKAEERHFLIFVKLFSSNEKLFKKNIVIINNFLKKEYEEETIIFLIKGGLQSITRDKEYKDEKELKFFTKRLYNSFNNIKKCCLYCLDDIDNNFFNCNNCDASICYECFKIDFFKNDDTLKIQDKRCSICKTNNGFILLSDKERIERIKEIKILELQKLEMVLNGSFDKSRH